MLAVNMTLAGTSDASGQGEEIARFTRIRMSRWVPVREDSPGEPPFGYESFMEQYKIEGGPILLGDWLRVALRGAPIVRRPAIWYGEKCLG